jgi:hypothetical protein
MRSPAMKICPTCKRRYADSLQFCLEDGTVLDPMRESEPTLVDPQATLRLTPRETSPPASSPKRGNTLILLGAAGVVAVGVVAIIAVIVVLQLSSKATNSTTSNLNQSPAASPVVEMRSTAEIIIETNNQVGIALLNGDTDALSRLLADDYRYVTDAGLTLNKAEVLLLMRTGNLSYESLKSTNERVEVSSDANKAELTAAAQSKGQLRHQTFNDTNFYRNTYEKRNGRWQLISGVVWHRQ